MRGLARIATLTGTVLVLIGAAGASSASAERPDTVPGLPVQLSLGDSWAAGFGATVPSEGGYVPRLHQALRERFDCSPSQAAKAHPGCKHLQLVNLAIGGATTPTLIERQLPDAVELLESRNADDNPRNDVELVTLHIGGNDVTNPIIAACLGGLTPACLQTIQNEFAAYRSDLEIALSTLRSAAGPETPIVIGTYDNPIATCFLGQVPGAIQLGALALEGGGPIAEGLDDIMRDVGADHGVTVAEVFGDLEPDDWLGGQDCLHPDDSGYEDVALAFLEALGLGD
jgi:lysophospholipase L1-like esterase